MGNLIDMLQRIGRAVVVGVVVWLACLLLGLLFGLFEVSWAAAIGGFLTQWAALIGLLAAVWHFFGGTSLFRSA